MTFKVNEDFDRERKKKKLPYHFWKAEKWKSCEKNEHTKYDKSHVPGAYPIRIARMYIQIFNTVTESIHVVLQ